MKIRALCIGVVLMVFAAAAAEAQTTSRPSAFSRPLEPTPLASIIKASSNADPVGNGAAIGAILDSAATFAFGMRVA